MNISDVLETCSKPGRWLLQYQHEPLGWQSVTDLADHAYLADNPALLIKGLIDQEWSLPRLAHAAWMIRASTPGLSIKLRVVLSSYRHFDAQVIDIDGLIGTYWRPKWEWEAAA